MKAITPVIAIILLLLIVIAVAGFTAVFLQETVAGTSETVEQAANTQTSTKTQFVEFVTSGENTITIKNVGTSDISEITVLIDGSPVAAASPGVISPGKTGTFTLDVNQVPPGQGEKELQVISGGNTIKTNINLNVSTVQILALSNDKLTIRNSAVNTVNKNDIAVSVGGSIIFFESGPDTLTPGETGVFDLDLTTLPVGQSEREVIVSVLDNNYYTQTHDISIGTIELDSITDAVISIKNTANEKLKPADFIVTFGGQSLAFTANDIEPEQTGTLSLDPVEVIIKPTGTLEVEAPDPASKITQADFYFYQPSTAGYWTFDDLDIGKTIKDYSGNGNDGTFMGTVYDGTFVNTPEAVNGKYGKGIKFVKSEQDRINLGSPAKLKNLDQVTIEFWMYPTTQSTTQKPLKMDNGYEMMIYFNNKFYVKLWTEGGYIGDWGGIDVPFNTWTHVTIIYDSLSSTNNNRMYFNGVLKKSRDLNGYGKLAPSGGTLFLAADSHAYGGILDEVRIYNRILSDSEIAQSMNSKYPRNGVVLSQSFEGITGTQTKDTHFIVQGKYDGALKLDESSDEYVLVPPNSVYNIPNSFSYSVWIYPYQVSAERYMISQGGGKMNFAVRNNKLSSWDGSSISGTTTLTTNSWKHAVLSYGGTDYTFYLDGIEDGIKPGTPVSSSAFQIGKYQSSPNFNFDGLLDEVRMLNKPV